MVNTSQPISNPPIPCIPITICGYGINAFNRRKLYKFNFTIKTVRTNEDLYNSIIKRINDRKITITQNFKIWYKKNNKIINIKNNNRFLYELCKSGEIDYNSELYFG
tara:strand:+ start:985 stop:1305 length:321 start_codon:yes stop_codon:yes gene_type:complete